MKKLKNLIFTVTNNKVGANHSKPFKKSIEKIFSRPPIRVVGKCLFVSCDNTKLSKEHVSPQASGNIGKMQYKYGENGKSFTDNSTQNGIVQKVICVKCNNKMGYKFNHLYADLVKRIPCAQSKFFKYTEEECIVILKQLLSSFFTSHNFEISENIEDFLMGQNKRLNEYNADPNWSFKIYQVDNACATNEFYTTATSEFEMIDIPTQSIMYATKIRHFIIEAYYKLDQNLDSNLQFSIKNIEAFPSKTKSFVMEVQTKQQELYTQISKDINNDSVKDYFLQNPDEQKRFQKRGKDLGGILLTLTTKKQKNSSKCCFLNFINKYYLIV